jgi:uncharacterized Fe-S cluster protein YjdI
MTIFILKNKYKYMDKTNIVKKYSNGNVTIIWKPALCIHSAICWKQPEGLPAVFNPAERPWIKPEAADSETLIKHVKKCPSGALSFSIENSDLKKKPKITETIIELLPNGPIMISGNHCIINMEGERKNLTENSFLCRCGASSNKPFCDGSHSQNGFVG